MTRKNKKEFVSPVGWYLASILMRLEWEDEDKNNLNRRCKAWENTILIKANSPSEAYSKAMKLGKLDEEKYGKSTMKITKQNGTLKV